MSRAALQPAAHVLDLDGETVLPQAPRELPVV